MARKTEYTGVAKSGPQSGAPYELPKGQWCSKGKCHVTPFTSSTQKAPAAETHAGPDRCPTRS
eukprot:6179164-Pleurochrysis_carterae.AAC.1